MTCQGGVRRGRDARRLCENSEHKKGGRGDCELTSMTDHGQKMQNPRDSFRGITFA
jgi:hypothetical protein